MSSRPTCLDSSFSREIPKFLTIMILVKFIRTLPFRSHTIRKKIRCAMFCLIRRTGFLRLLTGLTLRVSNMLHLPLWHLQMVRRSSPFKLERKIAVGPVYCIFSAVISGLRPHTLSAKSTEHSSRFCGLALFQKIEKLRASANSLSKIVNCSVQSGKNHPQCCKAH